MLLNFAHALRRRSGVIGFMLIAASLGSARAQDQAPRVAGTMPEDLLPGLREILQVAMNQSPSMIIADLQIAQNRASALSTYSQFWPHISGSAGIQETKERVSSSSNGVSASNATSESKGPAYNFGVNETLFQWGAVIDSAKIAHLNVLISERQYAQAYASLAAQVRGGYLQLALKKLALRNTQFNLKVAETAAAVSEDQFKTGAIPATQIIGVRMNIQDLQLQTDEAAEDYFQSKQILAHLAGLAELADDSIADEVPKPVCSQELAGAVLADLMRDGARDTLQAQIYLMQIRQANLNYHRARVNQLPQLSASAGYGLSNSSSVGSSGIDPATNKPLLSVTQAAVTSTSFNIGASWNIFDGFNTRSMRLSALASRRTSERQLAQWVQGTLDQAQDTERQLGFAARALALAETRRHMAEGALEQARDELKIGRSTQEVVDNATYGLYGNQWAEAQARVLVFNTWTTLVSLAGEDPTLNDLPRKYVRTVIP